MSDFADRIRIADTHLVGMVTNAQPGWVKAETDGHGGEGVSIIGFSSLPGTSRVTRASTGATWHTFVWQASEDCPRRRIISLDGWPDSAWWRWDC